MQSTSAHCRRPPWLRYSLSSTLLSRCPLPDALRGGCLSVTVQPLARQRGYTILGGHLPPPFGGDYRARHNRPALRPAPRHQRPGRLAAHHPAQPQALAGDHTEWLGRVVLGGSTLIVVFVPNAKIVHTDNAGMKCLRAVPGQTGPP